MWAEWQSHIERDARITSGERENQAARVSDIDDSMAQAVDIGENDDEEDEAEVEKDEKVPRNWSVLKSTPELRNSKPKPTKEGRMSLDEAVDDSENLTDFLMDFEEETDP
ncbi:Protein PLASTID TRANSCRIPTIONALLY ACTIVE 12 [Cardamine amara subsp. amara]|uniref:Protein PLASTID TRANSCRIPTIONALLY ACTIVE 12 n=1 Tax=Cardamine amara subsp. amara TaxID=228776 RepID=A0ABD1BKI6_CARAN